MGKGSIVIVMGKQRAEEMPNDYVSSVLLTRKPSVQHKEGRTNNAKHFQFQVSTGLERERQNTSSGLKNPGL